MNFYTVWAIATKDLRQFFRDRLLVLFLFLLPLMQLLLLVQATSDDGSRMPIGVLDYDRSAESRAFIALLAAAGKFDIVLYPETWDAGQRAIEMGDILGLAIIPNDTAVALHTGETATIHLIVDGTSSIVTRIIEGGMQSVIQRFVQQRVPAFGGGVRVETAMQYNPSLTERPFTIGAQLSMISYEITLATAALGFTREKEIGTLEQLMVTPVRRYELLVGKAIPPAILGLLNFIILAIVIRYVYAVPMLGSYGVLFGGSLLFVTVEVMWGTMLSALAGTQQQAILLVFIQAMTDVALSGFLVPVQDMPQVLAFFARVSPLQHFMTFTRAVMLKGAGLPDIWPHLAALAGIGLVTSTIAAATMARQVD